MGILKDSQEKDASLYHVEKVFLQGRIVTLNEAVKKGKSPVFGCWVIGQWKALGDLTRMCHEWGTNGWHRAHG